MIPSKLGHINEYKFRSLFQLQTFAELMSSNQGGSIINIIIWFSCSKDEI